MKFLGTFEKQAIPFSVGGCVQLNFVHAGWMRYPKLDGVLWDNSSGRVDPALEMWLTLPRSARESCRLGSSLSMMLSPFFSLYDICIAI